ncbi:unnamed protein product [Rotaria sordida]|uniref:Uncharacterized protein n=1 Tax=Rotaria sordida TaxID=392033 RepID=A0A815GEW8_9BILA|nr:unnamed protein product [Rotaria sordida]
MRTNRQVPFNFLQRFSQWEKFLCQKLRLLEKFKFVINICEYQFEAIESILTAFRTPFWLQDKRWLITCQLITDNVSNSGLILYSSEGTWNEFPFNTRESILSYFTFTTKDDNAANMSSKWYVRSDLARMVAAVCSKKIRHISQLALDIGGKWWSHAFDYLPLLIDLSQLDEIWLFVPKNRPFRISTINILFKQACNVRTLGLSYDDDDLAPLMDGICSVVSFQIDHLKLKTKSIDSMKLVLERVNHLNSVTFVQHPSSSNSFMEMAQWLIEKGRQFTISDNHQSLQITFEKNTDKPAEMKTGHKRMKLTHHQHNS